MPKTKKPMFSQSDVELLALYIAHALPADNSPEMLEVLNRFEPDALECIQLARGK
jgi:hypothetical protein